MDVRVGFLVILKVDTEVGLHVGNSDGDDDRMTVGLSERPTDGNPDGSNVGH